MKRVQIIVGLFVLVLLAGGVYLARKASVSVQAPDLTQKDSKPLTKPDPLPSDQNAPMVPLTGDKASTANKTSGKTPDQAKAISEIEKAKASPGTPLNYGKAQPVKGNVNAQAASVLEALQAKSHPERLSVMMPPKEPFDKAAYEANPKAYCDVMVPGRVFQTATPGPGVMELLPTSNTLALVGQNDLVKLSVKTEPGAPATFTSLDMGFFQENKLNSITVQADKAGMATATFTGGPGTIANVNILAGSPMATGQVRFKVVVQGAGQVASTIPTNGK